VTGPAGGRPIRAAVLADALDGGGGMARYTRELLRGLHRRDDVELVVVAPAESLEHLDALGLADVETVVVGSRGQIGHGLWERYVLGRHLDGVDVVHGTKHLLPRCRRPTVLTVHDLLVITSPDEFNLPKRLLLPRQYRRALDEATVLLAVSSATKRRLAALDPALGAKTTVVPNGVTVDLVESEPQPLPAIDGRPFALVVGDLSPRKNLSLLLDLWSDPAGPPAGLTLVVVGPAGWRASEVKRRLEDLERRGRVIWAREVDDAQLRACYEQARVVLAPALEEGFGLPVAEALTLGARVIASRDEALVEVGQGRPVHVDARDAPGWREAIERVVTDAAPPPSRPPEFSSWEANALATTDVYRSAIEWFSGRARGGRTVVMAVPDFHPTPAGTARQTAKQARALTRDGYDVVVLTRRYGRDWRRRETVDGVPVVRFGPASRSRLAEKLALVSFTAWLLRHRKRIGALQLLGYPDFALGAATVGLADRAVNVWVTDGDADETLGARPGPVRGIQRRVRHAALARGIQVALTPTIEGELAAVGLDRRVEIVPTPVDLQVFRPPTADERRAARVRAGLADDEYAVLYAGLLRERKRVERLVGAVGVLRASLPDLRLLVVGGSLGQEEHVAEALREQVRSDALGDVVTFVGPVDDVRPYLWAADVLVLPSDREGLPNSLQEAMACGVPCIAPRSAAGHEVMGDDAGIVPPGNSVAEIADAIRRLHDDPGLAASIRTAAAARVRGFSLDVVATRYEALFDRLAGRPLR
jgi:glycosyltransferase involved in cell wall biosynthesis